MKLLLAALLTLILSNTAQAGANESEAAVARILFDADMENASYSIRRDGFVDILFGPSVSDTEYAKLLDQLKTHPDIPGVLPGRGAGDYCPIRR